MSVARHHAEWLSLVEVSGPFLSMPVLLRVFPEGLDSREDASDVRLRVHAAHEEWLDNQGGLSPDPAIHRAWLRFALREVLEIDGALLVEGQALPPECSLSIPEHGERLAPTMAVLDPPGRPTAGKARLLIALLPRGQSLESPLSGGRWKASPATRMMTLLHGAGVRLGLVTNGEHWMLVHAAPNETTTYASFYSSLFLEEPLTLRAFQSLLGAHRLFGVADPDTLEALFRESGQNQQEVTDQLGAQVRRAIEVLVQTIDRADRDRGRALLRGVSETVLYEAAVTVMMRLVFLFAAEERGLLLLGDALYDQHYAVSTLRDQLQAAADAHGPEVLQRRHDAWSRLLATFRAVHGGVRHEAMRLPPYGGSLFDPDRFPFLEGRASGTGWRADPAMPLAVDNLTVLDLLTSLQLLEVRLPGGGPAEARRLSFRALDVEQIGHVYEGLLDHTARRAKVPVLSLRGSKHLEPEIEITTLEEQGKQGEDKLIAFLEEATGRSKAALKKAAAYEIPRDDRARWLLACDNDQALFQRVTPWAGLVREDVHGRPVVFGVGSVYVTEGQERRATGTHYTPRSLTEPIVQYTLEPLVYEGPAEGWPKEKWRLKSARDLLALRVCDMAMGSGAFLVQACRYLSERLVEAWDDAETGAGGKLVVTPEGALGTGEPSERPLPRNEDERMAIARRVVADRCLYGVDKNPMAVEMAKLSLWLVTLQKDRPFTFVDHALRCGDSLVGLTDPAQIEHFHLDPVRGKQVHGTLVEWTKGCGPALSRAMELRKKLESFSVESVKDAEVKGRLLREAEAALGDARLIADLVIGVALATATKGEKALDEELLRTSALLAAAFQAGTAKEREERKEELKKRAVELLNTGKGPQHAERRAFHWVLEFPEVFAQGERRGFDAFVGNPPFMVGFRLQSQYGAEWRTHVVDQVGNSKTGIRGGADLCAYFLLRVGTMTAAAGTFGIIGTNTIAQGDSREVGLSQLTPSWEIFRTVSTMPWPGSANLEVAIVWAAKGTWRGVKIIDGSPADTISTHLRTAAGVIGEPKRLRQNALKAFLGSKVEGIGFAMPSESAKVLLERNGKNADVLFPFLNGKELNTDPGHVPSRHVVYFRDWPLVRDAASARNLPVAEDYPDCLAVVKSEVRPYRESLPPTTPWNRKLAERWWQFGQDRVSLYPAIKGKSRVLVKAEVSDKLSFAFVPSNWIYSHTLIVVAIDRGGAFAVLQSSLHGAWATKYGSTMRRDLRYTPTTCFETFPFPELSEQLDAVGDGVHEERRLLMRQRDEGMTKLYGRVHDPSDVSLGVARMRDSQVQLDYAVAGAYGWTDLRFQHGFHEVEQGVRFTISELARRELLDRLLDLNHQRYAEEVAQGLHGDKTKTKQPRDAPTIASESVAPTEQGAFDFGDVPPQEPTPAKRGRPKKKS